MKNVFLAAALLGSLGARADIAPPVPARETDEVYQMDTAYQAAVKANDAEAMGASSPTISRW